MDTPDRIAPGPKVVVVDDDEATRLTCVAALARAGYCTVGAGDGTAGLELIRRENPALVLLDVDMPGLDGWQTLDRLRRSGCDPAIIMLTGLTAVDHRVRGLTGGADDYLCKPCDHRELLARVDAVLRRRRPAGAAPGRLHFGPMTVDLENRTAERAGVPVRLTRTEFKLLAFLASRPGQLATREEILETVWGYRGRTATRTVETHVWRLRRKLQDHAGEPRWIQTVAPGAGYRLAADAAGAARPE